MSSLACLCNRSPCVLYVSRISTLKHTFIVFRLSLKAYGDDEETSGMCCQTTIQIHTIFPCVLCVTQVNMQHGRLGKLFENNTNWLGRSAACRVTVMRFTSLVRATTITQFSTVKSYSNSERKSQTTKTTKLQNGFYYAERTDTTCTLLTHKHVA